MLRRSCQRVRRITYSYGGSEHPTYIKMKEGKLDLVHILRRNWFLKHPIWGNI